MFTWQLCENDLRPRWSAKMIKNAVLRQASRWRCNLMSLQHKYSLIVRHSCYCCSSSAWLLVWICNSHVRGVVTVFVRTAYCQLLYICRQVFHTVAFFICISLSKTSRVFKRLHSGTWFQKFAFSCSQKAKPQQMFTILCKNQNEFMHMR